MSVALQTVDLSSVRAYLLELQQRITAAIGGIDGESFVADHWQKGPSEPLQGQGITQILEQGNLSTHFGI